MPDDDQAERDLVAAIHTRRLIMCRRVHERHIDGGECPSCGL